MGQGRQLTEREYTGNRYIHKYTPEEAFCLTNDDSKYNFTKQNAIENI